MASAAVGKLWVGLDLKTGAYQSGLKRATGQTKAEANNMKGAWKSVFAGQFLANLATTAFAKVIQVIRNTVNTIKQSFQDLDALMKQSRRFDVSTAALGAWQQAAEIAGTGADILVTGLKRLQISLDKAKKGDKLLQAQFRSLGFSDQDIQMDSVEQAFMRISDAASTTAKAHAKSAELYAVLGRDGTKVALTMEGGAKALSEQIERARKDGTVFDEQQLAGIEAANDAMTRLFNKSKAFFGYIAIAIGPHIESIMTSLSEAFGSAKEQSGGLLVVVDSIAKAVQSIMGVFQIVAGVIGTAVSGAIGLIIRALELINNTIDKIPGVGAPIDKATLTAYKNAADAGFEASRKQVTGGIDRISDVLSGEYQNKIDAIRAKNMAAAEAKMNKAKAERELLLMGEQEDAASSANEVQATSAKALLAGTSDALSALNEFRMGEDEPTKTEEKIEDNTKVTAENTKKMGEFLQKQWVNWRKASIGV